MRVSAGIWVGVVLFAAPATADETIAGITTVGSVDSYVSINPARGGEHMGPNDLHAFDTQANGASFSFAKIALERKPAPVGFRLDLGFGPTIDVVNAADATAGMGHDLMRNIEQAYVSWAATPTLTLKIGKLVTHHGFEVIETQANWNYSQSLLFSWAIPFTETGLAADWVVSDEVETTFFLVNGLNNTFEGNDFKSPGVQVIVKPTPAVTLIQNAQAFNEMPGAQGGVTRFDLATYLFDSVASWAISPAFEVALNGDLGIDTSLPSQKAYGGVAAYGRWHATPKLSMSVRGEVFHDNPSAIFTIPGPMTGNVVEGTSTISYAPAAGLLLRAEARFDRGVGGYTPFTSSGGLPNAATQQLTFTIGAVAGF